MKYKHKLIFRLYKIFILNSKIRKFLRKYATSYEYSLNVADLKIYLIKDLRRNWLKTLGLREIKILIDPLFGDKK